MAFTRQYLISHHYAKHEANIHPELEHEIQSKTPPFPEPVTVLQQTVHECARKNNQILVGLATGGQDKRKTLLSLILNNLILSLIGHKKGSFCMRTSYIDSGGVEPSGCFRRRILPLLCINISVCACLRD